MAGREHALQLQRGQQPASARMTSISLKNETPDASPTAAHRPAVQLSALNLDYFRTIPGYLKMGQIFLGVICLGCGAPALFGFARFYMFVAGLAFTCTALISLARLLHISINIPIMEWSFAEMAYTGLACFLWLVAASVELGVASSRAWRHQGLIYESLSDQYIAAGVFGLFQVAAYGAGAFFLFIEWKASRPAPAPISIPQS